MLDELLDRLKSGGLDISIIPLNLSKQPDPSSVIGRNIALADRLEFQERLIRKLYRTMIGKGYDDKAETLKAWWTNRSAPLMDKVKELTAIDHVDADNVEEVEAKLKELADTLGPEVDALNDILIAITGRHLTALCETDISDLLV